MAHKQNSTQSLVKVARTYWLALLMGLMILLALAAGRVAAAPHRQDGTVPPPTPLPTATGVPDATATPVPDGGGGGDGGNNNSNNDDDDDNQPAPTATSVPNDSGGTQTSQAQQGDSEIIGVVLPERLNVRAGPGTEFAVVGKALVGETVGILERNADNSWWRICCATGTTDVTGWVSAQFIQLNFDPAQAAAIVPQADLGALPAAEAAPANTESATAPAASETTTTTTASATTATVESTLAATADITSTAEAATSEASLSAEQLQLVIEQSPPFVWQGQDVDLLLTVTNTSDEVAREVELRSELPTELRFIEAEAPSGATVAEEELSTGQVAFIVTWPTLAPGASGTVTVRVQVDPDLADGAVVSNLAVVSAANAEPYTTGVSIGMPPTLLPTFQ